MRPPREQRIDFVRGRRPLQFEHAIGERGIEHRRAYRMAVQLALQLGIDQRDCRGAAGGRGLRESMAERARRKSLCGASTTTLVLVGSWMVVIWPWRMPIASCTTFTTGREAVRGAGGGGQQPVPRGS